MVHSLHQIWVIPTILTVDHHVPLPKANPGGGISFFLFILFHIHIVAHPLNHNEFVAHLSNSDESETPPPNSDNLVKHPPNHDEFRAHPHESVAHPPVSGDPVAHPPTFDDRVAHPPNGFKNMKTTFSISSSFFFLFPLGFLLLGYAHMWENQI